MENTLKKAEEIDNIVASLTKRIDALESGKGSSNDLEVSSKDPSEMSIDELKQEIGTLVKIEEKIATRSNLLKERLELIKEKEEKKIMLSFQLAKLENCWKRAR